MSFSFENGKFFVVWLHFEMRESPRGLSDTLVTSRSTLTRAAPCEASCSTPVRVPWRSSNLGRDVMWWAPNAIQRSRRTRDVSWCRFSRRQFTIYENGCCFFCFFSLWLVFLSTSWLFFPSLEMGIITVVATRSSKKKYLKGFFTTLFNISWKM